MKPSQYQSQITEKDVLRSCLEYLSRSRVGKFWRQNTGGVVAEYKGKKRFTRFGRPGSGDITGILKQRIFDAQGARTIGQRVEIECKRPGGKQTPAQKDFQLEIEEHGGVYILARGVSDLVDHGL